MSKMTEADQLKFVTDVMAVLQENAPAFANTDFNPTTRRQALVDGLTDVTKKDGIRLGVEAALRTAVADKNTAVDKAYRLASADVKGVASALTEAHPLVKKMEHLRASMHQDVANPPAKPA